MTLPAFLLTYADSNCVWMGLKKFALPTVNARWSLARTAVLTMAQTIFGLAVALLLSILVFRQPVGWIFWFAGLMSFCQGVVCYSLTALCWNQRVAKLKENPNLPLKLPPARYVVFRWMLGLFYFVALALVTPLAMLVTIENVRGQTAWNRARARLEAQGERLTFREILGPEIPAADNAGAAPVFAPFFDYPHDGGYHPRPEVTNTIARLKEALFLPDRHLPEKPKEAQPAPKRPESLADWSAAYRALAASPRRDDPAWAKSLKLPAPENPARDVLIGLATGDTVVADICAAASRPRAQFPVHWEDGFSVLLQHLANLKQVQLNLRLRCAAHLAAGETDAAFAVATNALNVAELLREEPLLISQLVRMVQGTIAIDTLWQGLAEHRWTNAQLAAFQERLGRMDCLAGLILAFEGERVCGIVGVDAMIAGNMPGEPKPGGLRRAAMVVPLGMLRQNQVTLVRHQTAMLEGVRALVEKPPRDGFAAYINARKDAEARFKKQKEQAGGFAMMALDQLASGPIEPYSPYTILARTIVPATASAVGKAAHKQTTVHLAITACALERHRLTHGNYPETLEALVPAFLPQLPRDLMNGQPFHYRRTDDGWFLLYSVGEDGRDDGGVFRLKPKDAIKDWPWPVPSRSEAGSLF